jgi:hypothetical protein
MNSPQNYGFIYNEFIIDTSRNIIVKRLRSTIPENNDGKKKLQKEIGFYHLINTINIPKPFIMPHIYSPVAASDSTSTDTELHIQYFPHHEAITERFPYATATATSSQDSIKVIREILDCISPLHTYSPRLQITKKEYYHAILVECYDKIIERFYSVNWEEDIYPDIARLNYVNGVKVRPFIEYANRIKKRIATAAAAAHTEGRILSFIHGDTHLGNILVPKQDTRDDDNLPKYVFIDPRGYFASYDVYGVKEYDYAKLLFGISGYSRFDQMMIQHCDIRNADDAGGGADELCIHIPFIDETARIYESLATPEWQSAVPEITNEITRIISLSIWLGNNSTFVSPHKKLMSLMISRYLCERFL